MISVNDIKKSHKRTFDQVFASPTPTSLRWDKVEAMLEALGATVKEGRGSRVRVILNGVIAVFHRPHPQPEMKQYSVRDMKKFLKEAGYE